MNNLGLFNTTVEEKREHFPVFRELLKQETAASFHEFLFLVEKQFMFGGTKYNSGFSDREATDVISQLFGGASGVDWVLGTMLKYIFRYRNLGQEKDLLKIATYCYILWLKAGFQHLHEHNEDIPKQQNSITNSGEKK